eukprot:2603157-Amphidinium_carterae.1
MRSKRGGCDGNLPTRGARSKELLNYEMGSIANETKYCVVCEDSCHNTIPLRYVVQALGTSSCRSSWGCRVTIVSKTSQSLSRRQGRIQAHVEVIKQWPFIPTAMKETWFGALGEAFVCSNSCEAELLAKPLALRDYRNGLQTDLIDNIADS